MRIAPDRSAAHGALAVKMLEKIKRRGAPRPFRFHNLDNRRNHLASFLNHNRIADPDVFSLDFILVVQCCAANGAPANKHRFEHSNWCQNSSATNLDDNVEQACLDAFRFVFVSNRPAR